MTVLMRSALSNFLDVVDYLLTLNDIDVNKNDSVGLVALHYANGYEACMRLLLKHPLIDVNKKNKVFHLLSLKLLNFLNLLQRTPKHRCTGPRVGGIRTVWNVS
jgi:ankyrin repeat protein